MTAVRPFVSLFVCFPAALFAVAASFLGFQSNTARALGKQQTIMMSRKERMFLQGLDCNDSRASWSVSQSTDLKCSEQR
ncbi:hypothetical protein QBC32DRAFT_349756 [Pseudoneurospora amorphoporcata]|uniref:Uncharacterized protein n=1 Tax=Pseudoneurospora amorphoporcata TaxID=241081 RepID=A0AAN6SCF8_9PEZI|nr:hypothetical protein QBC32DRAFT_349756 [Pseudoneurospora amorphoporcata]